MLAETGASNSSRRSTHKSTSGSDPQNWPIQRDDRDDPPTIEEVVDEFYSKYPTNARTFLVHEGGEDPREPRAELREEVVEVLEGGDAMPITWGGALRQFLEWYDDREGTRGRFKNADGETFVKPLLNSYDAEYLETYYARLMALHREIAGGERPTDEWTRGEYENPHTALLALTSTGTNEMGRPRGPVDHQLERREAWGPTYKRLYDRMTELEEAGRIDDWTYVVIDEHHPGGGMALNAGFGHDHPVIIADGELRSEDLEPVIDAWIDNCPGAGAEAHEDAIKVRRIDPGDVANPDVMNSAGGYLTKYLYPDDGENHLRERSIEQLAHQTLKWATETRRVRKADSAGWAIAADRCRQAHDRGDQELGHGERLARGGDRGPSVVCALCESGWGVEGADGAESIVDARRAAEANDNLGETSSESQDSGLSYIKWSDDRDEDGSAWGAGAAGARTRELWWGFQAVGGSRVAVESYDNPPPGGWELEAVLIQDAEADGGEREARPSPGSSVDKVPVRGTHDLPIHINLDERRDRDRRGERPPPPPGPPTADQLGRYWSERPPPGDLYSQDGRVSMVRRTVEELEGDRGALRGDVIELLEDDDVDPDLASHTVDKMLERGELMRTSSTRVRVT